MQRVSIRRLIRFRALRKSSRRRPMVCSSRNNSSSTSAEISSRDVLDVSESHKHFAGRVPVGQGQPTTISKRGIVHRWRMSDGSEKNMHIIGAACSEVFSGSRLARILKEGHRLEAKAIEALESGENAPCLSIHTSAGTPQPLDAFIRRVGENLPRSWGVGAKENENWFVNLQMEGASAVWAAIDLLWQLQHVRGETSRTKIAVGEFSYHGPPSSSYGRGTPMGPRKDQVTYPIPAKILRRDGESEEDHHERVEKAFDAWLDESAHDVAVMLVEPQWGSSLAAQPWPKEMLRRFVGKAQERGILVCADEIMCGLFRHGKGTMFLSDAWDINPDAVTFGKSVAAGMFPLSGVALRDGAGAFREASRTAFQSHTYAGSSVRALMTGASVLDELPKWRENISNLEATCEKGLGEIRDASDGRMLTHGQGLMWGGMLGSRFDDTERRAFLIELKRICLNKGPWPYFVPAGGVMITPVVDADAKELSYALSTLAECVGEASKTLPA